MLKDFTISIEDELYNKAQKLFNEVGIDFNKGIIYLLQDYVNDSFSELNNTKQQSIKKTYSSNDIMSKSFAKHLFEKNGCAIYSNYTYASRGREGGSSSEIYWANPPTTFVNDNWSIVLNDKRYKQLYLLNISRDSFLKDSFIVRVDKPKVIDMRIKCNDNYYRDIASGISLKDFLIGNIDYSDINNPKFTKR